MPVYLLYGFRWPRAGFTGIRVYIVLHNLEDATAEYLQQPLTTSLLLDSFKKTEPGIVARLPDLRFIEQYDPDDTSEAAVSKTHAYVAGKVITMPEVGSPGACLSFDAEELVKSSGLDEDATAALTEMRDKYAAGEKVGWYIVYNGDPERYFPPDEEDEEEEYSYDEDEMDEDEEEPVMNEKVMSGEYVNGNGNGNGTASRPPSTPTSLLTRFFTKKAA